ncbi:cytochrome P450 [Streptantibioticus parmotrematis]|uniref:cytochrome P450 n=1 Tax=Streptantibioticus parmotrematis TaxID=2873249 RepID=UPI0033C375A1
MTRSADRTAIPVADMTRAGLGTRPLQRTMDLAREHGPLFVRRYGERDALFACSLDLVTELADEDRFAKAVGPALEHVREFAGDGLFTAYNDEPNWAKAHDILLPAFAMGSLRTYHPTMLRVARRLIASWDAALADGRPVEVAEDMTRMTLDTIGLAGFGYDFGSFGRDEEHPFVAAMVRCLAHTQGLLARRPDDGQDHAAQDAAFRADADYLAGVVDEVIDARRASGETGTDDLLGLMLQAPHPVSGETLDPANIRNQVITFLIAGHETTSGALSFALYHLLKNPAVLRRARDEVDALWGDAADPEPAFEDVGRLTYVRQVLCEALRLWPTAAVFGRTARADTELGGGRLTMRAGDTAFVLTPMLHRDPVWGDNVELFDPDRFAPERETALPPHAFKPFGTGERACIGRQFALHEAVMLLGLLIHRYRFLDHTGYQMLIRETLTLKPEGFTLELARRTDHATAPGPADSVSVPDEATVLATRVVPGTALTVLHGSNLGSCRELAAQIADLGTELGCEVSVAPLDAYADGTLPRTSPVVIVAASYNGRPTDDAAAFVSWLEDGHAAADGVRYAVLGVGDRNWAATYQRVPTLVDDRLAALGGERLLPRGEADAGGDLAGGVRRFATALRHALLARYGDRDSAGTTGESVSGPAHTVAVLTGGPLDALARRHEVVPMTVVESRELVDMAHPLGRSKRFVRLALPEGVTYRTGDHLAVLPVNDPDGVERAARLLGADPDTVLSVHAHRPSRGALPVDRPLSVRELLTHHLELAAPATAEQIAVLADHNPCPPERLALKERRPGPDSVLDLIERHPALVGALDWPTVLELLPALRPRHYSVSSSPVGSPRHVDLMVSLLRAPHRSGEGTYEGAGSAWLNRVRAGDTVYARVAPCREAFRVRTDVPAIMVAAGTGLAPFRGAVADRVALRAAGSQLPPALLYFGCDHPDVDLLHGDELRAAEEAGAVGLRPAFSHAPRDGRRYVQHRVAAEAREVWELLEAGAVVYVCGDATRLAPGVREAFTQVHAECATDGGDPAAWLDSLVAQGRYVEDVYAAG